MHTKAVIVTLNKWMKVDSEIISSCIKDDRKAIEQLYKICFQTLMPICYRYHINEEDARSSLNIGFLKIVKGLKDVDLEAFNFNAWSKRIMNNTLIDEYRKSKKHRERYSVTDSESELDYFAESDKNEALSNFGEATVLELIKELPFATAQVFNLYIIDGYAHKEIADMLDIPEGTSKWHLSQAKRMLREKLENIETMNKRMVI